MPDRPRRSVHRSPIPWIAAAVLLAGCASGGGQPAPPAPAQAAPTPVTAPARGLQRVADTSELRIGLTGQQPPLNMTAKNGNLIGMEVALGRVLAKSIGVKPIFVTLPFASLLGALESGQIDMVMSGMTITPKRSTRVTFVGPYYTSGKSLLTRSPELAATQVAAELDESKLRLVALDGSTSEDFVRESAPDAQLVLTAGLEDAIQKVIAGDVDALVADRETCIFAVKRHPDAGLLTSEVVFTVEPIGIAVPKNDPQFANLIQTYLTALEKQGALARVRSYWFENSEWVKDLR